MVLDMMIRTPSPTSTQKGYTVATDVAKANAWTAGKRKRIEVLDFYFNWRTVKWKDKTLEVEYDIFTGLVQQWIEGGMTKEEALDLMFDMDCS